MSDDLVRTETDHPVHTEQSASDAGAEAIERAQSAFGFAPNLVRVLADAPPAAHAYLDLGERFHQTSLSDLEQQVVLLTVSFENECDYCMAAHSTAADMGEMDASTLEALRTGESLSDDRLEALRIFTRTVVREGGWAGSSAVQDFLDAGFTRSQILEVVLGVAMKTLSNYTNHLARTPVDEAFEAQSWSAELQPA